MLVFYSQYKNIVFIPCEGSSAATVAVDCVESIQCVRVWSAVAITACDTCHLFSSSCVTSPLHVSPLFLLSTCHPFFSSHVSPLFLFSTRHLFSSPRVTPFLLLSTCHPLSSPPRTLHWSLCSGTEVGTLIRTSSTLLRESSSTQQLEQGWSTMSSPPHSRSTWSTTMTSPLLL